MLSILLFSQSQCFEIMGVFCSGWTSPCCQRAVNLLTQEMFFLWILCQLEISVQLSFLFGRCVPFLCCSCTCNLLKLCSNPALRTLNFLIVITRGAPNCCHLRFVPPSAAGRREALMEPIAAASQRHVYGVQGWNT